MPFVALYTQADLDNLRGTLDREAGNLAVAYGTNNNVSDPDWEPAQAAWHQWMRDYADWSLNLGGGLLGDQYLAGQALIKRAQALEARIAALGNPVPFKVTPPIPAFGTSDDAMTSIAPWLIAALLFAAWSRR